MDTLRQCTFLRVCLQKTLGFLRRRTRPQSGVAALEFALVLPVVLVLLGGVATFGSALYTKQLLYDMAGETARICVMKNIGDSQNVQACVQSVGTYLATSGAVHKNACLGQPIHFTSSFSAPRPLASPPWAHVPQAIYALEVGASCQYNFAPAFVGILSASLAAPALLQVRCAMPWLSDPSPR